MDITAGLFEFIGKAVSPFHTVDTVKNILSDNGFTELNMAEKFDVQPSGRYYIDVYGSSLMAFTIGKNFGGASFGQHRDSDRAVLRITSSHTDFPGFKIKPEPIIYAENRSGSGYVKLNTEVYGGPILNTWLDRPLSVAGRITVKGDNPFDIRTILVNTDSPVMIIPNLAIHMNRDVNKGVELNRQKDMLPVLAFTGQMKYKDRGCRNIVQLLWQDKLKNMGMDREDILDYELYLYNPEPGSQLGLNGEMLSCPRLDNLTSVYAQTKALINGMRDDGINIAMYFDNEEIGSRTKQGAASSAFMLLLEKIYGSLSMSRERLINDMLTGMMISCDVAHGIHPNSPEKSDITNQVMLGQGIVIKVAASQSYSNDAVGISTIRQICRENNIACQVFVNKSDMAGGQTLGAISSTVIPLRTIDIGIPLLAMHSSRELMGEKDQKNLEKFLTVYYS